MNEKKLHLIFRLFYCFENLLNSFGPTFVFYDSKVFFFQPKIFVTNVSANF